MLSSECISTRRVHYNKACGNSSGGRRREQRLSREPLLLTILSTVFVVVDVGQRPRVWRASVKHARNME